MSWESNSAHSSQSSHNRLLLWNYCLIKITMKKHIFFSSASSLNKTSQDRKPVLIQSPLSVKNLGKMLLTVAPKAIQKTTSLKKCYSSKYSKTTMHLYWKHLFNFIYDLFFGKKGKSSSGLQLPSWFTKTYTVTKVLPCGSYF